MAWALPTFTNGVLVDATDLTALVNDLRYLKGLDGVPYIEQALELPEVATPATPASGRGRLYIGADGAPRGIDDAGVIRTMPIYDAGAYTPTYTGSATAGSTTYTAQVGSYVRVGSAIWFTARVVWTAATGTGGAVISLPFAAKNDITARWAVSVFHNTVTYSGTGVQGLIVGTQQRVVLATPNSNASYADLAVEAAGEITVSGWYEVA